MSYDDEHKKDHDRILSALDCQKEVTAAVMEIALLKERIREMKEDRDKASKTTMWLTSFAFTIIMAVAGFGIQANATVQVHEQKIQELVKQMDNLKQYAHEHE